MPITPDTLQLDDGAAYELGMGIWSQRVGEAVLNWLAPAFGLRWADIGCGSGAFTETLVRCCEPVEIQAIDPSQSQLVYARQRMTAPGVAFQQADAMAIPFPNGRFDAAVMALVIFFVPDPARGVAEMVRVVCDGGLVAAYVWDIPGGGLPFESIRAELGRIGVRSPLPPSADISRNEALHALWLSAGLQAVETKVINVTRSFTSFEEFWSMNMALGGLAQTLATLGPSDARMIKDRVRASLPTDEAGRITCSARANAVRGQVSR